MLFRFSPIFSPFPFLKKGFASRYFWLGVRPSNPHTFHPTLVNINGHGLPFLKRYWFEIYIGPLIWLFGCGLLSPVPFHPVAFASITQISPYPFFHLSLPMFLTSGMLCFSLLFTLWTFWPIARTVPVSGTYYRFMTINTFCELTSLPFPYPLPDALLA